MHEICKGARPYETCKKDSGSAHADFIICRPGHPLQIRQSVRYRRLAGLRLPRDG